MGDDLQALVGRRIARFRKAAGLTQEQLAGKLSVALETISRMERGVNTPSIKTLGKIAAALGVQVPELLTPEGGASEKDSELENLMILMKRREPGEIRLVRENASLLLDYLDRQAAPKPRPRPRKIGKGHPDPSLN